MRSGPDGAGGRRVARGVTSGAGGVGLGLGAEDGGGGVGLTDQGRGGLEFPWHVARTLRLQRLVHALPLHPFHSTFVL